MGFFDPQKTEVDATIIPTLLMGKPRSQELCALEPHSEEAQGRLEPRSDCPVPQLWVNDR